MPRYDYLCEKCDKVFEKVVSIAERNSVKCECGKVATKLFTVTPAVEIFKPMVYEDICEHPIMISSKRQLREECKKHNVKAARLM